MKRFKEMYPVRPGALVGSVVATVLVFVFMPVLSPAMGLMDVYQQAVLNDPQFRSYEFRSLVAHEGQRQALGALLPTLVASGSYTFNNQDIISSENEVYGSGTSDYTTKTYAVTLTQPLFNWASIVGFQQSKLTDAKAGLEFALAGQELMVRVADLYFQALAARDKYEFTRTEQRAVARHFELAQGRVDMGLAPITDLHDARARLAATNAEVLSARNVYEDALQALSETTGGSVDMVQGLQDSLSLANPEPDSMEVWIGRAKTTNPAIELSRKAVEIATKEVMVQQAGHFPTLDAVASYDNEDTDGSLFGGSSEVATSKVGVQLTVPLYQGGIVSSRVRAARHELSIAQQDLIKQERSVERTTRSAFLGVESSLKRVDALAQSVEANRVALEAKQEGFNSGLYSSLSVLDAERDLAMVSIDHAQARYDYLLNSLRLKQAVGTVAESDLRELDTWLRR